MKKRSQAAVAVVTEPAKSPAYVSPTGDEPRLSTDFEKIVENVYEVDAWADYERVKRHFVVGEERGDRGTLQAHLDRAEDNARIAHRLFLSAKLERQRFEIEYATIRSPMWTAATRELQREKEQGLRSKQITDADVSHQVAAQFPDEWKSGETRMAKVKGTEAHLEEMADLAKSRCRSLQTMLQTAR